MKNLKIILAVTCLILMVSSLVFAGNMQKFSHQSRVAGAVECQDHQPAVRALVYFAGDSFMAMTDDEGRFMFRNVPPGEYELEIKSMGTTFGPMMVDIEKKSAVDLDIIEIECSRHPAETCKTGNDCDPGEYCQKDSAQCGSEGICVTDTINCSEVYTLVCGCDGNNYLNKCLAEKAGVNVRHEGWCMEY